MTKLLVLAISIVLISGLSSCYTNLNKQLEREVHVNITVEPTIEINNSGNSNFSGAYTREELTAQFMSGLKSDLELNNVVLDEVNPEFTIQISSFKISESTKTETINDTVSDNHGDIFELTSIDLSSSGTLTRVSNNETFNWSASKDKDEKVTTNRTAGQLITGDNKDKTEYREKELNANVALDFSNKLGERSSVVIVKEIFKAIN
ncbi:MAG: hypothetical protein HRT57_11870 [Crocinitomicaceae bacterium]|nr:hypothetical protein [Crocinitomicaceae bacterium]